MDRISVIPPGFNHIPDDLSDLVISKPVRKVPVSLEV